MRNLKYISYIALFCVLGLFLSFIAHGVLELVVIYLLESNFQTFGLGLSWQSRFVIHDVVAIILPIIFIVFGYRQGTYWWAVVYENENSSTPR